MPHRPFNYKANCDFTINPAEKNYKNAYKCSLKKISQFIKQIKILDPNAVVIIQGDHGWNLGKEDNLFYISKDIFNIFNAIYAPEKCLDKNFKSIDNVNSLRIALACASNSKLELIERKSFYGYYSDDLHNKDKFGKVFEIKLE